MGLHPSKLKCAKRWDLIHWIREHANEAATAGQENPLTKFARKNKPNNAAQLADYNTTCNRIWEDQQAALSLLELPDDDGEDDDGDDGDDSDSDSSDDSQTNTAVSLSMHFIATNSCADASTLDVSRATLLAAKTRVLSNNCVRSTEQKMQRG